MTKTHGYGGPRGNGPPAQRHGGGGPGAGAGQGAQSDRKREIEQALRPPQQPPADFAPNSRAVRPELLDAEAEKTAKDLAQIPANQLRRFYAEAMALKRRIDLAPDTISDDDVRAQMALLKAKAAYTCRRQEKYPIELVRFFARHAAAVRGKDDFRRGFQPHFEAVMAYHRVYEVEKGGGEG
jgi:CRISPR type III-A-associated protein Csm2